MTPRRTTTWETRCKKKAIRRAPSQRTKKHYRSRLVIPLHTITWESRLDQNGQIDEAIAHYQEAVKEQPNYPEAYYLLGNDLLPKSSS